MPITIEAAQPHDLPAIYALLDQSRLPKDGLAAHAAAMLVAKADGVVIGSAALELYDDAALLRSVAVAAPWRGRGLGQRLTSAMLEQARQRRVTHVYLLTETADAFFARFGFRPVARADVAPAVRRSVEFIAACPESARAMAVALA